jgi:TPP-dependent pyruvate/acetoin dehydrogenase alpha subunit
MFTRSDMVTSVTDISVRASAYGIPGLIVDGMDLLAVRDAAQKAIDRARAGHGPTLMEIKTYRFCGHSKSDNGKSTRSDEEIKAWQDRDPLQLWKQRLIEEGHQEDVLAAVEASVDDEVETAARIALESSFAEDDALDGAYAGDREPDPVVAERLIEGVR